MTDWEVESVGMSQRMVRANGVDLCVDTAGDPGASAVVLISGAAAAMDWWDPDFCERLAAGGRFVIRYDHRDTGQSVTYPPGEPGYTGRDLVADAAAIIDALAGGTAHLVGISMGGGIAQYLALEHPDRVASLTLISTSPVGPRRPDGPDLPPMTERLAAVFADPGPEPDWSDRSAVIDYLVDSERPYEAPAVFDEAYVRRLAARIVDRTVDIRSSMTNHWLLGGDESPPGRLAEVTAPTLVIHGTEDPMFPPEHGAALAREVPGAELLLLDGVGHQVPPPSTWDTVVPAILRHTSAAQMPH
jgi:pimeloyl-ACP methyl ester carboxylesterase